MEIKVESNSIADVKAGAIVVNLFEGVTQPSGATGAVDKALDGAITALIADGEIKGKLGETTVIHTLGKMPAARVVVAGLGKSEAFDLDRVRRVSGTVCTRLRKIGVKDAATIVHGAGIGGLDTLGAAQALAEGALLGLYKFDKYMSGGEDKGEVETLRVVEFDAGKVPDIEAGLDTGTTIAASVNRCRDMVNEPANEMTPSQMAENALEVSLAGGLEMEVLDRSDMEELGMGALLGVAQGSDVPPKLIVMRYRGDPGDESNVLGLLGKGITFDSGGLDLKPPAGMRQMKRDMSGGAAVISAMGAIAKLGPKINVTGIVAATENMPGANAQKPGDIVRTMSGKTIEIDNTDAEGRLVLADAMAYARSLGIERIVDTATLTGAILTALGKVRMGVFGNDQGLVDHVLASAEEAGERAWQFPMDDEYKKQYSSDVADIKNTGGRDAGSITGAQIIGEFADGAAWVHLDIAGVAYGESSTGYRPKGATGVPVRTLVNLAVRLAGS